MKNAVMLALAVHHAGTVAVSEFEELKGEDLLGALWDAATESASDLGLGPDDEGVEEWCALFVQALDARITGRWVGEDGPFSLDEFRAVNTLADASALVAMSVGGRIAFGGGAWASADIVRTS